MVSSVLIEKVTELSKTDTDLTAYDLTRVQFNLQCNYLSKVVNWNLKWIVCHLVSLKKILYFCFFCLLGWPY